MNPRAVHVAIVIGGVALAAFVLAMALFGGCAAPPLPAEPPITVTVHCYERDGGR